MTNRSDCLTVVVALCAFSFAATGQTSLVLSSGAATPGGTASLALSLANLGGTQLAALQWTLNYPSSSISGITVTAGPASTTAAKTIYCAGSGGTYTCLALGLNSNIIGDGVVANVQLSLTTSATSANITLSNASGASLAGAAIPVSTTGATLTGYPAFFAGEVSLANSVYSLQLANGNPFGYYGYLASGWIYHFDLGYVYVFPGSGPEVYLWDLASGHWWYTNNNQFPYLYDFTLYAWVYYFPDTQNAGHYTTNPRYFANMTTNQIFT